MIAEDARACKMFQWAALVAYSLVVLLYRLFGSYVRRSWSLYRGRLTCVSAVLNLL